MSRYSNKISESIFINKVLEASAKGDGEEYEQLEQKFSQQSFEDISRYVSIYGLMEFCPKLKKDLEKIMFDFENFEVKSYGYIDDIKDIMGLHTLDNGLTFIGCIAGGDWEHPVYFIIYHDGKGLRAYIPSDGNVYNKKYKCAYGSEGECEDITEEDEEFYAEYEPEEKFELEKLRNDIINRIRIR